MKWHRRWIDRAKEVAGWSKDPSTRVGCVLVDPRFNTSISEGYNGIPRNVDDTDERMSVRPEKYRWMEHAERPGHDDNQAHGGDGDTRAEEEAADFGQVDFADHAPVHDTYELIGRQHFFAPIVEPDHRPRFPGQRPAHGLGQRGAEGNGSGIVEVGMPVT